ncbi:MAG: hypothetical protein J6L88_04855 [Clostridia bacterium]|nr:hypothetical protein [Clostridia bacterium]
MEVLRREEGDERRHRRNCIYFIKKDGYCEKRNMKCVGSAHCMEYKRKNIEKKEFGTKAVRKDSVERKKVNQVHPFDGVKLIALKDIYVDEKAFDEPSQRKVQKIIEYYRNYGELDEPIVVACKDDKYIVTDRYLRYYAAQKLGLTLVPARIGRYGDVHYEKKLHRHGQSVRHKKYGMGSIVDSDEKQVKVLFESGKEIVFSIKSCVEMRILKFIKE